MKSRTNAGRIPAPRPNNPRRTDRRLARAVIASIETLERRLFLSASVPAFQSAVQISSGASPVALATDDFDGDGNEDLAVADSVNNNVTVRFGNGDGTFGKSASYAVGADPTAIATADVNGDGNDDIVTADAGSGDISVLLAKVDSDGNPTGAFAKARTFHVEAGGQGPMSLVADDFNNDGNVDLAVSSAGGLYILLGNGDGTFQRPTKVSADALGGIVSGDFNQDGNEDIAVTNPGAGTVEIFAGVGDGTFGAPASVTVAPGVSGITTGDFNSDGVTDLAVTVPGQNQVDVLLGDTKTVTVPEPTPGPIPIDPVPPLPIANPVAAVSAAGPIGATGSGGAGSSGAVGGNDFTYTTGTGTFAAPIVLPISGTPASITVDDVNGDGNDDLVIANTSSNADTVIPCNGDDTFGTAVDVPIGASPSAVVTDDFNGDAGTDFATANTNGTVSVSLQQSADVGVTLTSSAPRAVLGSNLIYAAVVTNSGPGSASNVTLSDVLPTGVTLVSATSSQGTVDTTTNAGEADASLGNLASGASATVTIVVDPTSYETLGNSVSINSDSVDPSYDNNFASINTPVAGTSGAEVSVAADAAGYFAQVGQNITDSFTVTNNGPDVATGLSFTDSLPAGITYVSSSTSQGTITGTSSTGVSASLGDLAVGASATVSVTFTSSTTGELTDTATVAAADPSTDPFAADNTATANTFVFGRFGPGPFPILPISIPGGGKGGLYTLSSKSGSTSTAAGPAGAVPTISISNVKKVDATKGTTQFTFTVTRSGNLNAASSLRYQTVDGTAKAGIAYQAASGQLNFASGVAQQTVTIEVNGAKAHLPTQNFVVALTGTKNATLKRSRATGTIVGAGKRIAVGHISKPKSAQNPAANALKINFEPAGDPAVPGYLQDTGLLFGSRGNLTFGWSSLNTANAVTRSGVKDPRLASFNLLGSPGAALWQIALPNGRYSVQIAAGDSTVTSGTEAVAANGTLVLNHKLKKNHPFAAATSTVSVTDGVLTLTDASFTAAALNFITIKFKG